MSIADRIAILRGQKTLNEFARENQTTPQNIHRYEKGRNPSADFLASLASQGININWVLTGEGPVHLKKKRQERNRLGVGIGDIARRIERRTAGSGSGSGPAASCKSQTASGYLVSKGDAKSPG